MKRFTIAVFVASALLASPSLAVHGPFSAQDGTPPGNTAPNGDAAQPSTRDPGANGAIAREAEKGNPNEDGTLEVIDSGDGGLFPGQSSGFPGGDGARNDRARGPND